LLGGGTGDHYHGAAGLLACGVVDGELRAADWVVEVDFEDFVGGGFGVGAGF
jgi:hypothetical protein